MDIFNIVLSIIILLFSAIIHEISHGVVAGWFGDNTAREQGRITLNPIPHIDPIMTILLPAVLALSHLPVFGAAKPVPVSYSRMDNPRLGLAAVSLAGPFSNFLLACIAGILLYTRVISFIPGTDTVLGSIVIINILLGVFNFIPIPPLDGSRIIGALLPNNLMNAWFSLDRFGFILVFILIYAGFFDPILNGSLNLLSRIFGG